MKQKKERLPEAELEVMLVLWHADHPLSVSEIVQALAAEHPWKPATVHVLLDRLSQRGFLEKDTSAFAHRYTARISEKEYGRSEAQSFLSRFCGGSVRQFVTMMTDAEDPDEDELDELYEMLDAVKRRRKP